MTQTAKLIDETIEKILLLKSFRSEKFWKYISEIIKDLEAIKESIKPITMTEAMMKYDEDIRRFKSDMLLKKWYIKLDWKIYQDVESIQPKWVRIDRYNIKDWQLVLLANPE